MLRFKSVRYEEFHGYLQRVSKISWGGVGMDVSRAMENLGVRAAKLVEPQTRLGLGSGATAECFIRALSRQMVKSGKPAGVRVVASSSKSAELAARLGLEVKSLTEFDQLDLTVDGADQISPSGLLIKGGGGALFREKALSLKSQAYVILADWRKFEGTFGEFPLPLEIAPFAWFYLKYELKAFGNPALRMREGQVVLTDNGNWLVDLKLGHKPSDWRGLYRTLKTLFGVLEVGIFHERAPDTIFRGLRDGVVEIWKPRPSAF